MLKQQPIVADTQNAPPTTQEIARAIASLEARKSSQDSAAVQTDTVREVIEHFGLDISTDEVLAEVQAQRARTMPLGSQPPRMRRRMAACLAAGALLLFGTVWLASEPTIQANPAQPTMAPAVYNSPPSHLHIALDTLVQDSIGGEPTLKTLAEVPDNHPVQCGISDGQATMSSMDWTLVKHQGEIYLRCWTVPMSERAFSVASANQGLFLFARRGGSVGNAPATAPLTVPISGNILVPANGPNDTSSLNPLTIHLDNHAHEPWNTSSKQQPHE